MIIEIQNINKELLVFDENQNVFDKEISDYIFQEINNFDYELSEFIKNPDFESTKIKIKKPTNFILPLSSYQNDITAYSKMRSNIGERLFCIFNENDHKFELKPFQKKGSNFLLDNKKNFKILADDMGLGKTVQAASSVGFGFSNMKFSRVLIVVPNHLVFNWIKEFETWAPNLKIGPAIPNKPINEEAWRVCLNSLQVIVTSYEKIKTLPDQLKNFKFDLVVADEAQRVKNAGSDVTESFANLKSSETWLLTGTPVENSKEDMITLLKLSRKTGANDSFKSKELGFIRSYTRQFLLRRIKEDVLEDLPEVNIVEKTIELSEIQRTTYHQIVEDYKKSNNKMNPLQVFNLLRKTCDYDEATQASSKASEIIQIVNKIIQNNEKVVIFSYTLEPLRIIQSLLPKNISCGVLTGEIDLEKREEIKSNFQYKGNIDILLATAQVAGTGATFTKANHVIFFNEWWNPALNAQARDRIVRIGQEKECFVYKFYTKDTVEQRLKELLEQKTELFNEIVEKLNDESFIKEVIE